MNRIDRLFAILLKISDGKVLQAEELAAEFDLSDRTIYRDMRALIGMGIPIQSEAGVGYQLREGFFLPPLLFEKDEAVATGFALKLLTAYSDSSVKASQNALKKIESVLPQKVLKEYLRELEVLDFVPNSTVIPFSNENFRLLVTAVKNCNIVDLEYITFKRDTPEIRQIEPVKLFFAPAQKSWYLEAFCRIRDDWRLFRLDRIIQVTPTESRFLTRHRENNRYHAEPQDAATALLFASAEQARWIREQQHWSFVSEESDSEGVVFNYRNFDYTFINWLCTVSDYTLRIEPKEIKEELRKKIGDLQKLLT